MNKLTPAPWFIGSDGSRVYVLDNAITLDSEGRVASCFQTGDAEFIALARNAFDVMMRRGWVLYMDGGGHWIACERSDKEGIVHGPIIKRDGEVCWYDGLYSDPFTALVEADKWYRENVEVATTPKE